MIVASTYNARFVDPMIEAAGKILNVGGVKRTTLVRVPGAYEIPLLASMAAQSVVPFAAIICLGVIIRGETAHAQLIAEAVTRGLMDIQLRDHIPIVHEVLLLENEAQAVRRCLDPEHNRGAEAAQTALALAVLMDEIGDD